LEGPFVIAEVLRPGTYKLATTDGDVFTNVGTSNSYIASTLRFSGYSHI
jgi:hypothetical protein